METNYSLEEENLEHMIEQMKRIPLTRTVNLYPASCNTPALILDSFQNEAIRD